MSPEITTQRLCSSVSNILINLWRTVTISTFAAHIYFVIILGAASQVRAKSLVLLSEFGQSGQIKLGV